MEQGKLQSERGKNTLEIMMQKHFTAIRMKIHTIGDKCRVQKVGVDLLGWDPFRSKSNHTYNLSLKKCLCYIYVA